MKQVCVEAFCLQCGRKNEKSYVVLELEHFSQLSVLECECGNVQRFRVDQITLHPVNTL